MVQSGTKLLIMRVKNQVIGTLSNQTIDLGYTQIKQNLSKKSASPKPEFIERRKGDRRKSIKSQKVLPFGAKVMFYNQYVKDQKKPLKEEWANPKETTQAYQKTTQYHANWQFPSHVELKKV